MKSNIENIGKALDSGVKVKDDKAESKHDKAISDGYLKMSKLKTVN